MTLNTSNTAPIAFLLNVTPNSYRVVVASTGQDLPFWMPSNTFDVPRMLGQDSNGLVIVFFGNSFPYPQRLIPGRCRQ